MSDGPNQEDAFSLFHLIVGVDQVFAGGELSPKSGIHSSPITGLEWPRGLQEVKVPRFHDDTGWW